MGIIATNICNDALDHLGSEPINSLSEESKQARLCNRKYPIARDFVLRQHNWNFALKRLILVSTGNTPQFGEVYEYVLPDDSVRVAYLVDDNWRPITYKVEGRKVYIREETANLVYVSNITPENYFDAEFKKALGFQLASDMAYSITQNVNVFRDMTALANDTISNAKSTDSQEGRPEDFTFNYFDESRSTNHEIYPESDFF